MHYLQTFFFDETKSTIWRKSCECENSDNVLGVNLSYSAVETPSKGFKNELVRHNDYQIMDFLFQSLYLFLNSYNRFTINDRQITFFSSRAKSFV